MLLLPVIITGLLFFDIGFSAAADCTNSGNIGKTIVVARDSRGHFRTVQDAINSVPSENNQWVRIIIGRGVYKEVVTIPHDKPCIFLNGMGTDATIITNDRHDQTDTSVTFYSAADYVVCKGITFKNSYNRYWSALDELQVVQAVAARIEGDKSAFINCAFLGVQDTLWDSQNRHYYQSCYFEGAVDFIFGKGQSYFKNCVLNSTVGLASYYLPTGYVTAQGRDSTSDSNGFIFDGGKLIGSHDVYLGRAWGPASRVVFYGTSFDSPIAPNGWDSWSYTEKNIMYSEVGCGGAGSDKSKRVPWMTNINQLSFEKYFSRSEFIDRESWLHKQPLSRLVW